MHTIPERIAAEIAAYLMSKGDRLATDLGMLTFRDVAGVLVAELGGQEYIVAILVTPRSPCQT